MENNASKGHAFSYSRQVKLKAKCELQIKEIKELRQLKEMSRQDRLDSSNNALDEIKLWEKACYPPPRY
jgi:DNA-binding transcriptional regulator YiaG